MCLTASGAEIYLSGAWRCKTEVLYQFELGIGVAHRVFKFLKRDGGSYTSNAPNTVAKSLAISTRMSELELIAYQAPISSRAIAD